MERHRRGVEALCKAVFESDGTVKRSLRQAIGRNESVPDDLRASSQMRFTSVRCSIYDRLADALAWHVPAEPDFWPKQTEYLLKYGYEGGKKATGG